MLDNGHRSREQIKHGRGYEMLGQGNIFGRVIFFWISQRPERKIETTFGISNTLDPNPSGDLSRELVT